MMRTCSLVCLVVAASAVDAISASPESLPVAETSLVESVAAVSCRANTYYWGSYQGRHYCVKCPAATISNGCNNCNKDPKHRACYKPLNCPKGKFVDKGGIICTSCPTGKWQSKEGKDKCWNCPTGMFQPKEGLHSCYACPTGRYADSDGAKTCKKCDTCKKGTYGNTAKKGSKLASDCKCDKCGAGKFAPEKYTTCFDCPAGRYQSEAGSFSCYYCPTGKFQTAKGSTTCDKCPIGTTTPKEGSFRGDDCKKSGLICPVGQYRQKQADGTIKCSVCPAGMYGKLVSASYGGHCYKCDAGKYQDLTGKTACKQCEDGEVPSADRKSCGSLPTYEVHFRLYNYQLAAGLVGRGWKLLGLKEAVAMKSLIFGSYKQEKGFELLGSWQTTSCCITLAQGYRMTANGVSFVYPMDSSASSLKCSSSMNYYTSAHKMRLAFHNGNNMAEITGAAKIGGAVGSGLCAKRAGENNPGIFMARTKTTKTISKERCQTIGSERLCLAPPPTPAPTNAPTNTPTQEPTQRPTMVPTPFNTPSLPKHCKKVSCQSDTPKGCSRKFVHKYNDEGCPLFPCGKLDCTKKTKIDCQVSEWGAWSTCSKTCGSGHIKATRTVEQIPLNGGAECPILMKIRPCRQQHCPTDCEMSKWSKWSGCSATCGEGVHRRHRSVLKEAEHGGSCNVKDLLDTKPCKASGTCAPTFAPTPTPTLNPTMHPTAEPTRMPINCEFEWNSWTQCTRQCGGGKRSRKLIIITEAARGGNPCPAERSQEHLCNTHMCPEHCKVSDWEEWSECSTTCGFGTKSRSRSVTAEPKHGGTGCPELHQKRACEWVDCPIHCIVSEWGSWGRCSMECGEGVRQRVRSIVTASEFGGSECPSLIEDKKCNRGSCPVNCKVGEWSKFTPCDKSCGVGKHTRTRKVLVTAKNHGAECPPTVETELCHAAACPIHCIMEEWGAWSSCTKTCGIGENKRSRSRNVLQHAQNGGKACADVYQEEDCEMHACPVHCVVYKWQKWNECSKTCGSGLHMRYRAIKIHNSHGGKPCPHLKETDTCNEQVCPQDCQVSSWGDFGECTKSCNGGSKTRTRTVLKKTSGGKICPTLKNVQNCNTQNCPVDCRMSKWSKWSACDKSCSTLKIYGSQYRRRTALKKESHGGKECSKVYEEQPCNSFACPVDCQVGSFNDWTECSVSCGTGFIYRTRPILRPSAAGGMKCPALLQSTKCVQKPCTVKCQVTEWSEWTECDKSCGTGYQVRKRGKVAQKGHRMNCPSLEQTKICGTGVCPTDCKMTAWEDWSPCSHTCGGGEKKRRRSVDYPAAFGGKACGMLQETAKCYTEECPIDCAVGKWSAWPACSASCGAGWTTRKRSIRAYPTFGGAMCPRLDESRQCNEGQCPVHCDVSKWSKWSTCTKSCGGGVMKRTREVITKAANGGYKCPNLKVEIKCNTLACPNDCAVSEWGAWGECDKTCGQGYKIRLRSVVQKPTGRGKPCPALTKTLACNTHKCPIDCKYTKWTPFGECSKSCGAGHMVHRRSMLREAAYGGVACGDLQVTKSCNMHACPINCVVSEWSKWSQCSKKCGGGYRSRSRKVVQEPTFGGWKCPVTNQKHSCNQSPCALNCEVSDWGFWSDCSKSCGIGATTRVRQIISHAHKGEWICPHLSQTKSCNVHACPADCEVSLFTKWGPCDATCGGGVKHRKRAILKQATRGGSPCPALNESKECAMNKCPLDCVVSKFTEWTDCDKSCGTGSQVRSRSIVTEAERGGNKCPVLNEARQCATKACPVDCEVTEFKSWSPCSATCGWGQETRTRIVKVKAAGGGKPCPDIKETRACQEQECPVSCQVTPWSTWSSCDRSCGAGKQKHTRTIVRKGKGGKKCPATEETRECNSHECPKDCKLSEFLPWSTCTATCGGGTQTQYRVVISPALYGGKPCGVLTQTQKCGTKKCPIDCQLTAWEDWSTCDKSCGHGRMRRERKVLAEAKYAGEKCGDTFMTRPCDSGPCPTHCEVSKWGAFSECTKSCGAGKKTRTRTINGHAKNGGYVCPSLSQTVECNSMPCAVDCTVTGWSAFDLCDKECGKGRKYRTRVIVQPMVGGGKPCPPVKDSAVCDAGPCAVKCVVSQWGKWGACDKTCGGGLQIRSRKIKNKRAGGVCPWLKQTRECNVDPCPIDCVVGKWSNWGGCSKSCGSGKQTRTRKVRVASRFEGMPCPALAQTKQCETQHCPIDCGVTAFGSWSKCTKTCGTGEKRRQRHITGQTEMYGGKKCPHLLEHSTCNNHECPVDCKMSRWGPLSDCSVSCGHGTQTRARTIVSDESFGGKPCSDLYQNVQCNLGHCPNHCQVSQFGPWSSCSKTCGMGKRFRARKIIEHGGPGYECPALRETASCSVLPCKVDCEVSNFGQWTTCSRSCNTGFQSRTRAVMTQPKYSGKPCPSLRQARICNDHKCPVNCQMEHWTAWKDCSVSCGTGIQKRSRKMRRIATFGGKECKLSRGVYFDQHRECDMGPCPVKCSVTSWSDYSECSEKCGTGFMTRTRSVTQKRGGDAVCPLLKQTKECNTEPCAQDCVYSQFGKWSACTRTCGGGMRYRERHVIRQPNFLGKKCPALHSSEVCGKAACPVDCEMGPVSKWTQCSKSCGRGFRYATRNIVRKPVFGGKACGAQRLQEACNAMPCPIDCDASRWSSWSTCVRSSVDKCARAKFRHVLREPAFGGKACPAVSDKWEKCPAKECANLTKDSCSHVKCIYYKESAAPGQAPVGHIRVYHHNAESRGNKHVCKHIGATCQCSCHSETE